MKSIKKNTIHIFLILVLFIFGQYLLLEEKALSTKMDLRVSFVLLFIAYLIAVTLRIKSMKMGDKRIYLAITIIAVLLFSIAQIVLLNNLSQGSQLVKYSSVSFGVLLILDFLAVSFNRHNTIKSK